MSASVRFSRLAYTLLLSQIAIVSLVALLRHAGAQEKSTPAVDAKAGDQLTPTNTTPTNAQTTSTTASEVEASSEKDSNASAPQLPAATPQANSIAPDFVLDEIRRMLQDPDSGMNVPRLSYPSLDESAAPASAARVDATSNIADQAEITGGRSQVQIAALSRRLKSIEKLSQAASALAEEAQALAEAGDERGARELVREANAIREVLSKLARTQ